MRSPYGEKAEWVMVSAVTFSLGVGEEETGGAWQIRGAAFSACQQSC
jgi:hypothetical protein